jgi:hypothetical protein
VGRDGREYSGDLASEKQKYFFERDWTGQIRLIWLGKLIFRRNDFFAGKWRDGVLDACSIGSSTAAAVATDLPVGRAPSILRQNVNAAKLFRYRFDAPHARWMAPPLASVQLRVRCPKW